MKRLLVASLVIAAACGVPSQGVASGTYGGVYPDGSEVVVVINGNMATVNGEMTNVDDTQSHLTFDVLYGNPHPHWVCTPDSDGLGITCQITTGGTKTTVELMQE